MTEVDHLPRLSSGAQRMRRYRERRRRGLSCHFGRLRVSHQQHTMSRIVGVMQMGFQPYFAYASIIC
jgi:hypothetical protein